METKDHKKKLIAVLKALEVQTEIIQKMLDDIDSNKSSKIDDDSTDYGTSCFHLIKKNKKTNKTNILMEF